jgi:hypothetical protein
LARSNYQVNAYCPFAKNSIKSLLFYDVYFDFSRPNEIQAWDNYIDALKDNGTIYLYYEHSEIQPALLQKMNVIEQTNEIDIEIEYISNHKGNFYKLQKK